MILYDYPRSSAAFRVRIALKLKGLCADAACVHLLKGEQDDPAFRGRNPQGLVPVLETADGLLTQSLAIIEYLDEVYPRPPLLPRPAAARAHVRALALAVACDIHPLNNLRVLKHLTGVVGLSEDQKQEWARHWIAEGFSALETTLAATAGRFCHGMTPTLADVCLVPQVVNARRVDCDLAPYPTIRRIFETCMALPAFSEVAPAAG